jgi:hypothetical protein
MRVLVAIVFGLSLALSSPVSAQPASSPKAMQSSRAITFNGRELSTAQLQRLEELERGYGTRLPDRAFWYDNRSGAIGLWQGPAIGALPPGLGFGGPLPANASAGGTGVFINGRELHPLDVAALAQIMQVQRGRFWSDSQGNFGYEGGGAIGNVHQMARAAQGRQAGSTPRRVYQDGELAGGINNSAGNCTTAGNCAYR